MLSIRKRTVNFENVDALNIIFCDYDELELRKLTYEIISKRLL